MDRPYIFLFHNDRLTVTRLLREADDEHVCVFVKCIIYMHVVPARPLDSYMHATTYIIWWKKIDEHMHARGMRDMHRSCPCFSRQAYLQLIITSIHVIKINYTLIRNYTLIIRTCLVIDKFIVTRQMNSDNLQPTWCIILNRVHDEESSMFWCCWSISELPTFPY
jgi:hypothetical protein